MQMKAVHGLFGHDVDPAIGHLDFPAPQVHVQKFREYSDAPRNLLFQLDEGGRHLVQLGQRSIRGVTAGVILLRPFSAGLIVLAKLVTFLQQFGVHL